jgi:hypothetical protein
MQNKMDTLFIPTTKSTPMVDFRPSGMLWIAGNAYPLDAGEFFSPLDPWVDAFLCLPPREVEMHLVLNYCNDSFAKYLLMMLKKFEYSWKENLKIFWYSEAGDEDMDYLREVLEECLKMKFEFLGL